MAKKRIAPTTTPYHLNPEIVLFYELPFGAGDLIVPNDVVRIKNTRGRYRVIKYATNQHKAVTWVDCMNVTSGQFHSFYVEDIKRVERAKRSYRKKINAK